MASRPSVPPFMGATAADAPEGFAAAVFGAPHGTAYEGIDNRIFEGSPDALRQALAPDRDWVDHWDFDLGRPLLDHGLRIADLGNLPTTPTGAARNRQMIEDCTRACLEAGAVPLMLGGDDSTPIPFLAGFAGGAAITILQIDAHIDWRHERHGETLGFSSTMRRASEMSHVWRIVQAGAHGLGSAGRQEVRDAVAWGARLVTAQEIHGAGIAAVLAHIPPDADCVIALDVDALDVSQMPAVAYPTPGGLTYTQVAGLIAGVAAKARIAGFSLVEFVPGRDSQGTAAFTAARLACNVIGRLAPVT
jgi:agmatinase